MTQTHIELLKLAGADREMGMQQGKHAEAMIRDALGVVQNLDALKSAKPAWMPQSLFLSLAKRHLSRPLWRDIQEFCPRQAERIESLAGGAHAELRDILFLQSLEMLIGTPHFVTDACTCLAFDPSQTSTNEVIVAKNFDYMQLLAPYQIACESKPAGRYANLSFKMGSLPGAIDGMNEHGLTLVYNLAHTTDRMKHHVPLSFVIQEVLETCRTTGEAVEFVCQAKIGGHAALLTIADAQGTIKVVELTSIHRAVRGPEEGKVINTNHYQIAEMKEYQVPKNAVFAGKSPYKGKRIHESSERRYDRAHQMLSASRTIDETRIMAVLRDHSGDTEPSKNTICNHGRIGRTIRSSIFYPSRRKIKALHGNPCENEYGEIRF
jgi:predicted choloylglycine hydrolase